MVPLLLLPALHNYTKAVMEFSCYENFLFFIQVILSEPEVDRDEYEYELEKRTTAVFYSITSTQKGDIERVFVYGHKNSS